MPGPTFIDRTVVTKTDGTSNTTMTINKPASATAGRIGIFKLHSNSVLNPNSLTLDANVTAIANNYNVNGNFAVHSSYSYRVFTGSDPSAFTFTVGGDSRDDDLVLEVWDGVNTASPIGAIGSFTSNTLASFVVSGVTTTANDSIVLFEVATKDGTALTAVDSGYPTGTTGIASNKTRNNSSGLNSGSAYQYYASSGSVSGSKTWSSYLSLAKYGTTIAFELKASAASVSVSGSITVASSKAFTTTGLTALTGVTVATTGGGSVSATYSWATGSGSFTVPMWSDAAVYPYFGSVTVTVTDGTLTPNTTATLVLPSGYAAVTFASVASTDKTYLGKYFVDAGIPLLDGDRCYYQTTNNLVIAADSSIVVDELTTVQIAIHRAVDYKTYTYTMAIGLTGVSRVWVGVGEGL